MRYLMSQKILAAGDDFTIKDENKNDRYYVDGHVFTIGKKFVFQDMEKNELARIQQKLFALRPTYHIYRNNETAATVKRSLFSIFSTSFSLDVPGPDDMDVKGNFLDNEYAFTRGGQTIATVSKKLFSLSDSYGIDIADGEDDVLILSAVVVIDACCHGNQK